MTERPYVVDDTETLTPEGLITILGSFDTEREASEFIETLPGYLSGRYGISHDDGEA